MRAVDHFTLGPPPRWGMMREYRRHLTMAGRSVGVVWGDGLRQQLQCEAGFIVVTSYDYFEGTHHWFYLLDANGHVLDRVSTPDYFGFIQNVEVEGESSVAFGFFGTNDRWSLAVRGSSTRTSSGTLIRRFSCFVLGRRRLILRCSTGEP